MSTVGVYAISSIVCRHKFYGTLAVSVLLTLAWQGPSAFSEPTNTGTAQTSTQAGAGGVVRHPPNEEKGRNTGAIRNPAGSSTEEYLRGIGEGDLSKGRIACQRISELAARTDLAKQIRIRVTEHAVDRLRDRLGQTIEQDMEVVREEMVNELLRDVQIVDKRIDESHGTCTSVAVMPRSRILSDSFTDPHSQMPARNIPSQ